MRSTASSQEESSVFESEIGNAMTAVVMNPKDGGRDHEIRNGEHFREGAMQKDVSLLARYHAKHPLSMASFSPHSSSRKDEGLAEATSHGDTEGSKFKYTCLALKLIRFLL